MATSGVISLHLRSRNPKSHYTRCSGRNSTKQARHHSRCTWEPRREGQNVADTLGPHVWSSRRPTLPRTEIPPPSHQTTEKKRANIANAIATHTIPRPCLQNLAIFSGLLKTFLLSFMTVFARPQDLPSEWKPFEAGAKRVLLMAHLGANMQ
jgi:hypothetical protein